MSDDTCPRHPGQPVVAVCIRFDRRYCEIDFADPAHPVECLSVGTHCADRPRCMLWVRMKDEQRLHRQQEAEIQVPIRPPAAPPPESVEWTEAFRGPLGVVNLMMIFLLYDEEFRVKIVPVPGESRDFMLLVPEAQAAQAHDVLDFYHTKWKAGRKNSG